MDQQDKPADKRSKGRIFLRRSIVGLIRLAAIAYLGLMGLLVVFDSRMVYFPTPFPPGPGYTSEEEIEDLYFETPDGFRLHSGYLEAEAPKAHLLLGLQLHEKAQRPKEFVEFRGLGHNDPLPDMFEEPVQRILARLETH